MNDDPTKPSKKAGRPPKAAKIDKDAEAAAAAEALRQAFAGRDLDSLGAKVRQPAAIGPAPVPVEVKAAPVEVKAAPKIIEAEPDKVRQDEIFQGRARLVRELLGSVVDDFGFTTCPGAHKHSTRNSYRDFRIFGLRGKTVRGQCFHSQCRDEVDAFNERLANALVLSNLHFWPWQEEEGDDPTYKKRLKKVDIDPKAIETIAASVPESVNREWLKANSPVKVSGVGPDKFLRLLYPDQGDRVLIFDSETTQGQMVWHPKLDPTWEQRFTRSCLKGVWFLVQPVSGTFVNLPRLRSPFNPSGRSRRAAECVTEFRYLVLESDNVDVDTWVKVLVNLPLPVVSVTSSGSRSLHALVWVGAKKQQEWEDYRYDIERVVASLGCDQGALKAVQLSRLPGCLRHQKFDKSSQTFVKFAEGPAEQELLYLNPSARGTDSVWTLAEHSNA